MILNNLEFALMNNPVREAFQRHLEAQRFLRMGGAQRGAKVLEVGCGRGVGVELILDTFGAASVDAFDLDPRMVARALRRLNSRGSPVRLWVGDAAAIAAPNCAYDAVLDFGIIHHVPDWRAALKEIHHVLCSGGTLYVVESLGCFLFAHSLQDRFEAADFRSALRAARFTVSVKEHLGICCIGLLPGKQN